jgi:hypothetical protein
MILTSRACVLQVVLYTESAAESECLLYVNTLGFFSFKDPFIIKSIWNLRKKIK